MSAQPVTMEAAATSAEPPFRIHRYPSALIEPLTLRDGRRVVVRPVLPQDAEAEQAFFAALSPASRRHRFHGAVRLLPLAAARDMTAIDYRRHLALVAEVRCADGGESGSTRVVADVRFVHDGTGTAEFAVAVADEWQGQGLGRAMLALLARHARARGVRRLEGQVLADNTPMLAMLERMGAEIHAAPDSAALVLARFVAD